jgi:hypothetical protein
MRERKRVREATIGIRAIQLCPVGDMTRADESFDAVLDPEDHVPQHVGHTGNQEDEHADEGQPVADRQGGRPGRSPARVPVEDRGERASTGDEARVENRVPRGEERLELRHVDVRPPVEVEAAEEPGAERHHQPVEPDAAPGQGAAPGRLQHPFSRLA